MGLAEWLGIGKQVKEGAKGVGSLIESARDAITGEDHELALREVDAKLQQAQVELNKIEAASSSPFVAGWRPLIGWLGGICLALYFVPQYALASFIWISEWAKTGVLIDFPASPDAILELVFALLGVATLRTAEKFKGVQDKH
jgi:hypothetical protein